MAGRDQFGPWAPWRTNGLVQDGDVAGLFAPGKKWRSLARIKDGTSNTVIIAEPDAMELLRWSVQHQRHGYSVPNGGWAVFRSAFVAFGHAGWATNEGGTTRFAKVDNSGAKTARRWFRAGPHSFTRPT